MLIIYGHQLDKPTQVFNSFSFKLVLFCKNPKIDVFYDL